MAAGKRAYEDFEVGATLDLGSKLVTAEDIAEFAALFPRQPDETGVQTGAFDGPAPSGWHACCIFMRLMCDAFLVESTSQGSPGIDRAEWRKPVLAGDRLTAQSTILSKRMSSSRPGLGLITMRSTIRDQHGECVLELENTGMFLSRGAGR